jgi:hypothetical protein
MIEITPTELIDLLDTGFEPIEVDYLCFLRWAVRNGQIGDGEPERPSELSIPSAGRPEVNDPFDQARQWLGGF